MTSVNNFWPCDGDSEEGRGHCGARGWGGGDFSLDVRQNGEWAAPQETARVLGIQKPGFDLAMTPCGAAGESAGASGPLPSCFYC